jgi:hypothetical protein
VYGTEQAVPKVDIEGLLPQSLRHTTYLSYLSPYPHALTCSPCLATQHWPSTPIVSVTTRPGRRRHEREHLQHGGMTTL